MYKIDKGYIGEVILYITRIMQKMLMRIYAYYRIDIEYYKKNSNTTEYKCDGGFGPNPTSKVTVNMKNENICTVFLNKRL